MSKHKPRQRIKGASGTSVDAEAVHCYWQSLSIEDRKELLRFGDPALVERLFAIWQQLCVSDMACYVCGILSADARSKKFGNDMFAIEGYINSVGDLHDAAFYARPAFVETMDVFQVMEEWLGSPFLEGRSKLPRQEWPTLFKISPNSWSDCVRSIFHLVELALWNAEAEDRQARSRICTIAASEQQSQSAKRRSRKKRINLKLRAESQKVDEDVCPVCDGERVLLGDPCPLCGESSDDDDDDENEDVHPTAIHESSPDVKVKAHLSECFTTSWSSRWTSISKSIFVSDWQLGFFEHSAAQSSDTGIKSFADGPNVGLCASVKNTFVHVSPVGAPAELFRSRSLPSLWL
jgi:hypothetical protein